ncbi:MAG: Asp-tRNA(Asn)/Glu-tRNA(Gln) amidotransferase subunit GatB [Chloroflexi bacterium]|nr:Asp-tRNA(Asn)/Glu-tRNA(Gln) amidotransferase subunit GatB [Chloroflexota bacterium]
MEYEPTIGLETHAQLLTASKVFCSCSSNYAAASPNTLVCPVCLGMPGSLPVINQRAVEYVIMTGLALNCRIAEFSRFDRKNYHYPDLVKGYQISQYDLPLCRDGWVEIQVSGGTKRIGIQDVHLEEDTGKLIHVGGQSLIDFNRSGVPLMEIVTKPDFTSIEEVREYVLKLRRILRYLGVSSGNMEEGAMRFEANVSLHPAGVAEKGTRVEIKNLNSFRALLRSLEYEINRQNQVLQQGGKIDRETRGWDDERGVTFVQRSKEFADDYRYFPEPDLPPLEISREWVEEIRSRMPELPDERYRRFLSEYGLSAYDAGLLTDDRPIADYFEQAVAIAKPRGIQPKTIANWITGELFRLLRASGTEPTAIQVPPEQLVELIVMLNENSITMTSAKHVLEVMFHTGKAARDIVAEEGLLQIADANQIAPIVDEVIRTNPDAVAQYKGGKETVLRFLVGQVMRATRGKADPNVTAELLRKKLSA